MYVAVTIQVTTVASRQSMVILVVEFQPRVYKNRPVYYSVLKSLGKRSQNISIKFPINKQSLIFLKVE